MRNRKIFALLMSAVCLTFLIGFDMQAKASYLDVINTISRTAETVNSVNRGARGTMSTIEASQRFTDRQQDRKDRKRAEKSYNETAEQEYYRTLQETRDLNNRYQYYNNDL